MTVLSSKSFTEINLKNRREKGPLVKVQIAPGQFVKMYRADAVEAGHLRAEKARQPAEDKLRPPAESKASPLVEAGAFVGGGGTDDLTTIPGVGLAT
ncbi:MAG: hypothetical protein HUU38_23095, partial [Anaerolineales bacterium]|nr:hypothetical protein [Anaerolineales bacterium]